METLHGNQIRNKRKSLKRILCPMNILGATPGVFSCIGFDMIPERKSGKALVCIAISDWLMLLGDERLAERLVWVKNFLVISMEYSFFDGY